MRIAIIGAGPAGLYVGYLLKRAFPEAYVRISEKNPENVTWGFGVVFSDAALDFLREDDPVTHQAIVPHMQRWRNLTLDIKGACIELDGIGFSSIARLHLLQLLTARARSVGVDVCFNTMDDGHHGSFDLVIGADGVNSVVREQADFGTTVSQLPNKFIWYGCDRTFDTLTQSFRETRLGDFNAHHYRYSNTESTFIIETDANVWARANFAKMSAQETIRVCEELFADVLQGARLKANHSVWRNFPQLHNERWHNGKYVLIGDSLHTAHFSIGSGTRLALEDAISLEKAIQQSDGNIPSALVSFEASRRPIVDKIVAAAQRSAQWYESFSAHMKLPPWKMAESYVRRAGRIDDGRLRAMSPQFMAGLDRYKQLAKESFLEK